MIKLDKMLFSLFIIGKKIKDIRGMFLGVSGSLAMRKWTPHSREMTNLIFQHIFAQFGL